jgi:oxepin-CoA hydrolase/3-oxo-5,6-dehydrosuberyl-CoA semialdehyde dehydrogenase
MLEKFAPAFLAGVPSITKPATTTAYVAEAVARLSRIGNSSPGQPATDLRLDRRSARPSYRPGCFVVHWLDRDIRETPQSSGDFTKRSRFVAERDSLNAAVLGPDVTSDQREFDLFIREVVREMTVKSGQKCTAIRRILVPRAREQAVIGALTARLSEVKLGDPRVNDKVMGPFGQSRATGIRPRAGCRPSEL